MRIGCSTVGCTVPGAWILHWGVSHGDDVGRYGTVDQLKDLVKKFHEVNIKVLGDVVLNHRCARYKNSNGVWNIVGGKLNWDDHAVVADDPHFQGRGNKISGDNFHAAPNIDQSQDFVRKDVKEWLYWLRDEIGYDGWRLDFMRGFWGGYVKDYLDASEPYFAVGEYWDSLRYTYIRRGGPQSRRTWTKDHRLDKCYQWNRPEHLMSRPKGFFML